jgi:tetratricopeptide (TPR) repeat protein
MLDAREVLSVADLNVAHWKDAGRWARVGLDVAAEHGLEARRAAFTHWLSNALVWGNSDARESLRLLNELLARETRRSARAALLSGISLLHGLLDDRASAEAADAEAQAVATELGSRHLWFRWAFTQYGLGDIPAAMEAARMEADRLATMSETGTRSTMLAFQAWLLALTGEAEQAVAMAEEARKIGAVDDAVTQIIWRIAAGLAQAKLGNLEQADRLTADAIDWAAKTDSLSAADAWEARARVLAMLGRRGEMLEAAGRARELHAAKGSVNFVRRVDLFLAEQEAGAPGPS